MLRLCRHPQVGLYPHSRRARARSSPVPPLLLIALAGSPPLGQCHSLLPSFLPKLCSPPFPRGCSQQCSLPSPGGIWSPHRLGEWKQPLRSCRDPPPNLPSPLTLGRRGTQATFALSESLRVSSDLCLSFPSQFLSLPVSAGLWPSPSPSLSPRGSLPAGFWLHLSLSIPPEAGRGKSLRK